MLQVLLEQARALAVPPDDLNSVTGPTSEEEEMAVVRIGLQNVLDQG